MSPTNQTVLKRIEMTVRLKRVLNNLLKQGLSTRIFYSILRGYENSTELDEVGFWTNRPESTWFNLDNEIEK